ncbi:MULTISPECIES: hypothetical protein [Paenibacillus]|uniref:hypothetical protein n=1 Tax=Paenibacillus TaxID=44249 RepID=UPI00296FBE59|nr:hypothetical protein [Paenibacillus sp. alder61]
MMVPAGSGTGGEADAAPPSSGSAGFITLCPQGDKGMSAAAARPGMARRGSMRATKVPLPTAERT